MGGAARARSRVGARARGGGPPPGPPPHAADALAVAVAHAWRSGPRAEPDRAQHGGAGTLPRATGRDLTPAQRMWAGAERMSRRRGAVAPGGGRGV